MRLGPRLQTGHAGVFTITELRPHQLLAQANPHARDRFSDTTLARLRDEADCPVLRRTLITWAESGFNLVRASTRLHIHRNSLLYRGLALELGALSDQFEDPGTENRSHATARATHPPRR
ncbi:MAG: helix-turn-helix domain-containing protein [Pseudonocardia sp.]|nr:helix-turn-helix domain-containing protein [Pseudonocardia sp.]